MPAFIVCIIIAWLLQPCFTYCTRQIEYNNSLHFCNSIDVTYNSRWNQILLSVTQSLVFLNAIHSVHGSAMMWQLEPQCHAFMNGTFITCLEASALYRYHTNDVLHWFIDITRLRLFLLMADYATGAWHNNCDITHCRKLNGMHLWDSIPQLLSRSTMLISNSNSSFSLSMSDSQTL